MKVWEYCYIRSVEQGDACTVCLLSIIKSHTFGNEQFKYVNISKIKKNQLLDEDQKPADQQDMYSERAKSPGAAVCSLGTEKV